MGEALKNASSDLEKGVSNALGIDPTAGEGPDPAASWCLMGAMHDSHGVDTEPKRTSHCAWI